MQQLLAVGEVVAVHVRRIDNHLVHQRVAVVLGEAAEPQYGIEPILLQRVVQVNHRIAGGGAGEAGLGHRRTGQRIHQCAFAHAGSAHQHHHQHRPFDIQCLGLALQINGESFDLGALDGADGEALTGVEPAAQLGFEAAQQRGQRAQKWGLGVDFAHEGQCMGWDVLVLRAANEASRRESGFCLSVLNAGVVLVLRFERR